MGSLNLLPGFKTPSSITTASHLNPLLQLPRPGRTPPPTGRSGLSKARTCSHHFPDSNPFMDSRHLGGSKCLGPAVNACILAIGAAANFLEASHSFFPISISLHVVFSPSPCGDFVHIPQSSTSMSPSHKASRTILNYLAEQESLFPLSKCPMSLTDLECPCTISCGSWFARASPTLDWVVPGVLHTANSGDRSE